MAPDYEGSEEYEAVPLPYARVTWGDNGNYVLLNGNNVRANLYRVVIFRYGAERANQMVPLPMYESRDPEYLWKYMAGYEAKASGQILAIQQNGNLSNGLLFSLETLDGRSLDSA